MKEDKQLIRGGSAQVRDMDVISTHLSTFWGFSWILATTHEEFGLIFITTLK